MYVVSYLANSVPALAAGAVADRLGVVSTVVGYAAAVALLGVMALLVTGAAGVRSSGQAGAGVA